MTKATAIGLFAHTPRMPSPHDVMRAYYTLEKIVRQLGAEPTYFSADDGMGRGEYAAYGGALQKAVLGCGTRGYRSVDLAANPVGSNSPAYDSFVRASFAFAPEGEMVETTVVANEPYLSTGSEGCDELIQQLSQLWQWDYGFGFGRNASTMPEVYLGGAGSNLQSPEDERRGDLWHAAYQPERRRSSIRDVFPYNMVGKGHLTHQLPDGRTLRDFILADSDSVLSSLTDELWLWKVTEDRTETVRDKLRGTGIVISE